MPSRKNLLLGLIAVWSATLLLVAYVRHGISGKTQKLPTIFISIASYRDFQCMHTVLDAYSKARHKSRIFVGVVQQNAEGDTDCLTVPPDRLDEGHLLEEYKDNIRIHRVDHRIAKGPTWARHMVIDKLFRGEDYVFQIDSHSRFVPDWDLILMNNIEQLPPKSCISHYPSTWDPKVDGNQLPKDYDLLIARMCKGFYNNEHILIPVCGLMTLKERRSVPALIAGAGMTLYPGSVHKDMDMDPHLPFLFQGEELLFTMRMVSKGYKVFSPAENIVFHYYGRKDNAKFFDLSAQVPDMEQQRQQSLQRAKYIMGYLPKEQLTNPSVSLIEIDKYKIDWEDPIVKARMDKYFKVFDINLAEKKVGDLCSKGELDDWPIWD